MPEDKIAPGRQACQRSKSNRMIFDGAKEGRALEGGRTVRIFINQGWQKVPHPVEGVEV